MTVAYVFPGQGSQYVGMGWEIATVSEAAAAVFEDASSALGYDLLQLCREGPESRLSQTQFTQPAVLTTSLACLAAAVEVIPEPSFVAGHSLGEYSALAAAGVLRLDEAVRLVRGRGQMMEEATRGRAVAMAAIIGLSRTEVEGLCRRVSDIGCCQAAAYNEPRQTVVSGDRCAVRAAAELAETAGGRAVDLEVSSAFHTAIMTPVAPQLARDIGRLVPGAPTVAVLPNVTASPTRDGEALLSCLVRQLDQPVRWVETMTQLRQLGVETVIELGPGRILSRCARHTDRSFRTVAIGDASSLKLAAKEMQQLRTLVDARARQC